MGSLSCLWNQYRSHKGVKVENTFQASEAMQHKPGRQGESRKQFGIPDRKGFKVDSAFLMQHRAGGRETQEATEKEIGSPVKRHSEMVPREHIPTQQMVNENKKCVSGSWRCRAGTGQMGSDSVTKDCTVLTW
jgi:nitrogen fixation protein FixH